jgi:hypothetical protein
MGYAILDAIQLTDEAARQPGFRLRLVEEKAGRRLTSMDDEIRCPNCGSSQLVANQRVKAGALILGDAIAGPLGFLIGALSSRPKIIMTCLKCGESFRAGQQYRRGGGLKVFLFIIVPLAFGLYVYESFNGTPSVTSGPASISTPSDSGPATIPNPVVTSFPMPSGGPTAVSPLVVPPPNITKTDSLYQVLEDSPVYQDADRLSPILASIHKGKFVHVVGTTPRIYRGLDERRDSWLCAGGGCQLQGRLDISLTLRDKPRIAFYRAVIMFKL